MDGWVYAHLGHEFIISSSYTMSGYLRYVIPEKIIEELSD